MIWREDQYDVDVIDPTAQTITNKVKCNSTQLMLKLTLVYGFNKKEERKELWEYLATTGGTMKDPWIVLGDFNSILHLEDRIGENKVSYAEIEELQKCIDACKMMEMAGSGCKYTWNDNQNSYQIFSKIDWCFINGEWLDEMPTCGVKFLPERVSDHSLIHVKMQGLQRGRKAFRYCNVRSKHHSFETVIRRAWDAQIQGYSMYGVVQKLKKLKYMLRELHREFQ
ncbi:uncharacterized protein LOC124896240 [Capsicum annuum]|uniref:uncharacterized protein LOC124896240 n=1 Tax=Capsicum annuum TaxID=4072 RepID=UPI001FB058D1|nr:uncharacterized protein LOC124896240 [Capsicum annuum]